MMVLLYNNIKMDNKKRIVTLEQAGFNWLEIADLLNIRYEEVRELAEED